MTSTNSFLWIATAFFLIVTFASAFSNQPLFSSRTCSYDRTVSALSAAGGGKKGSDGIVSELLHNGNYHAMVQNSDKDLVLVDCFAQWCGPCKLIEPFLQQSALQYQDSLHVLKCDMEQDGTEDVRFELLLQEALPKALPHLVLFHKGQVVDVHTGVLNQDKQNDYIEQSLKALPHREEQVEVEMHKVVKKIIGQEEQQQKSKGFVSFSAQRDDYALSNLSF